VAVVCRLCCRLAAPLVYNYLSLCFESDFDTGSWMTSAYTGERVTTAFSQFYGSLEVSGAEEHDASVQKFWGGFSPFRKWGLDFVIDTLM
jgi:hypothetical protein